MTVDVHRARRRKPGRTGPRALLGGASLFALLSALLVIGVAPAPAQETVIIGGNRGGTSFIGGPGSGVTINNEVLDSLGPAGPAPGLPYMPQAASPSLPSGASIIAPGPGATAYRIPGTGQLVVSRPSTLLFPPLQTPGSRLTVTPPARAQSPAAAPQMVTAEEPRSRLLVPPPPRKALQQTEAPQEPEVVPATPVEPVLKATIVEVQPPSAPAVEPPTAPDPKPEPKVAAEPKPAPESQAAAVTPPAPAPAPVESAAAPPAPPSLTQELQATAEPPPAPEPPVKAEASPPPSKVLAPEKSPETQTAALPPPTTGLEEFRVLFKEDSAELSKTAKGELDAFAKLLNQDTSSRIQLLAYAKAADSSASHARRLSLSRALAVRAYLIDQGVRSTRMDVRARGHIVTAGPVDRVDILPQAARQ